MEKRSITLFLPPAIIVRKTNATYYDFFSFQVFENLLLDHDWSLNAGNWMWLSASAFFHAFFRVYSPVAFGKKTDPNGDYIK